MPRFWIGICLFLAIGIAAGCQNPAQKRPVNGRSAPVTPDTAGLRTPGKKPPARRSTDTLKPVMALETQG